jgi:hypothetical protein
VREAAPEVMRRVLDYRRNLLHPNPLPPSSASKPDDSSIEPSAQE